jgi:hypothetical protein
VKKLSKQSDLKVLFCAKIKEHTHDEAFFCET